MSTPTGGDHSPPPSANTATDLSDAYLRVQASDEFQDLKRRFRRFVFPMTAFFLTWYFLYVMAAIFAHDFMSIKVFGNINVGLLFGLAQFVTTFAITIIYVRWANREFDPRADAVGERISQLGGHQ